MKTTVIFIILQGMGGFVDEDPRFVRRNPAYYFSAKNR